jgi:hypothetical protein
VRALPEPLTREEHIKCADCAEVYVIEIWRKQITAFASEIITGEYAVNFDEYQKRCYLLMRLTIHN